MKKAPLILLVIVLATASAAANTTPNVVFAPTIPVAHARSLPCFFFTNSTGGLIDEEFVCNENATDIHIVFKPVVNGKCSVEWVQVSSGSSSTATCPQGANDLNVVGT